MMLFNSYIFIFVFLPLLVAVYFLCTQTDKLRKFVLIAASIIFYTAFDLRVATVLIVSVLVNGICLYLSTRIFVILPIVLNLALLLYFKYTNFFIENINLISGSHFAVRQIVLPLGISFFTFQQIAYIVSYYRGQLQPGNLVTAEQSKQNNEQNENRACGQINRNKPDLLDYLTYILYFPKLVMGPLMEPADFLAQIHDPAKKKINLQNIACGLKIFSYGLFKKMILADTFAKAVNWGFANPIWPSSLDWILMILFNSFMIYFDFSGYTDMAVGASLMLNIELPINFDSPYKATSVRDFWKRWHISLTAFLTKYIYVPLGGNRKGLRRTCINVMLVFLISGLWHGANLTFILWGFLHGVLSVAERLTAYGLNGQYGKGIKQVRVEKSRQVKIGKKNGLIVGTVIGRAARTLTTFIIVSLLWLLFSSPDTATWVNILSKTFSFNNMTLNVDLLEAFSIPESSLFILPIFGEWFLQNAAKIWMVLFTLGAAMICFVPQNNYRNLRKLTRRDMILTAVCFVSGVIALGQASVFVYFNF